MAVTRDQVIDALRPVQDPELHRSIVELDMVRDVVIDGGDISVLIALTVAGCPLRAEITSRVTAAVQPLAGVTSVSVDMTVMTPEELEAVRGKLGGGSARGAKDDDHDGHGHGHGPKDRHVAIGAVGSKTRIIGVTSGKGGVGKSSVTVNLAVTLARMGQDVAVLDADVYGFSVPAMLGAADRPEVVDEMVIPARAHGVRCISMGFFVEEDKPVMWRGPMLHKALEQFLVDVQWGSPDILLIDMPPGTGDVAMSMAKLLPRAEMLVVTTPQPAAQRVAQRAGAMAREIDVPIAGIVENMSWFTGADGRRYELFGAGGGQRLSDLLDAPLLAHIPLVPMLREGADIGVPITVGQPQSEVALAFEQLAQTLVQAGRQRIYLEELAVR